MGTKYEGSIKQKVDNTLRKWAGSEEVFTIGELVLYADLQKKRTNVVGVIAKYVKLGAIVSKRGMPGAAFNYTIVSPQLIGNFPMREKLHTSTRSPVKRIEPITKECLDAEISYTQLGEVVYKTMKRLKEKVEDLERELIECKAKHGSSEGAWRSTIKGKDKTIEDLKEQVELLLNKTGKFKMSELAPDFDKINLVGG